MKPDGTDVKPLTQDADISNFPGAFSPDGAWLATMQMRGANEEIAVMRVGQREKRDKKARSGVGSNITNNFAKGGHPDTQNSFPAWSPSLGE
jgi:hypothetical protein